MLGKILTLFILCFSAPAMGFVVLIDPGHGGEEYGAVKTVRVKKGKKVVKEKVYEKDLALSLAKKVKNYLDPYYTTYLTRSFDRSVGLNERAEMADAVKADLFISIHFNSATNKSSHGFETYYLDNHADAAIKKVETVENKYLEGADKVVNHILIDLVIQKTVSASKKLAGKVHKRIKGSVQKKFNMKDRGIKPGLFYVLALSKRPGILVEAGFMSHHKEIWKLRRKDFLNRYAKSIAEGVKDYFKTKSQKDLPLF
ncbi:MAG: hypothetical protein CME64_05965 [Halobacteriovoraceae bacterium]|nr:hypothetical protein [Halobacteriovoraceae bacterium]|tara:strand:+ start:150741 stop:151508 length:768 start_codon:yes stop_codon:yes gene_type:complete